MILLVRRSDGRVKAVIGRALDPNEVVDRQQLPLLLLLLLGNDEKDATLQQFAMETTMNTMSRGGNIVGGGRRTVPQHQWLI